MVRPEPEAARLPGREGSVGLGNTLADDAVHATCAARDYTCRRWCLSGEGGRREGVGVCAVSNVVYESDDANESIAVISDKNAMCRESGWIV